MPDHSTAMDLIGRLGSARVAVIGDLMLDRYVYGSVERVSPEAPIPVLGIERDAVMLGGAGNVARNIAALGARAVLIGVAGQDDAGKAIADLLAGENNIEADITVSRGRATSVKTRFVAAAQQLLRTDRDDGTELGSQDAAAVRQSALAAIDGAGAVVLSDYAKGVLGPALIEAVCGAAKAQGIPVIADPKARDFGRYRGADIITPNRAELAAAGGAVVESDEQAAEAARRIITECGIGAVLATRGADGMTLVEGASEPLHIAARAREVFDVSGAGDTVVAAVAAGLAAGADLATAAELANSAAGVVVGKVGTAVVYADDLESSLHAGDLMDADAKVASLSRALDRIEKWRVAGDAVVFTNGCFDLIHPGHVALLAEARACGDRLIVGLNADVSVRRLKGEGRPVQGEAARAAVLASFAAVDLVVIFAEDTPLSLIEALKPDVLVKGADYAEDEVVGAEAVKAHGGKVVLAKIIDGHSTTETISRLNGGGAT